MDDITRYERQEAGLEEVAFYFSPLAHISVTQTMVSQMIDEDVYPLPSPITLLFPGSQTTDTVL